MVAIHGIANCFGLALLLVAPVPSSSEAIVDLSQDLQEDIPAISSSPGAAAVLEAASQDLKIRTALVLEKGSIVANYIRGKTGYENAAATATERERSVGVEVVNPYDPFQVWSTTKSWMSLLIGILVQDELLSIEETLGGIFQDDSHWADVVDGTEAFRKNVTIKEMLTMTSGLTWPESILNNPDLVVTEQDIEDSLDSGGSSLSDSLADPDIGPKNEFSYLGVNNILSYVIKTRADMSPREFLQEKVMSRLGVAEDEYDWQQNADGVETSYHGLMLTPYQMAKFGQLYLQRGLVASGDTLISQDWVDASLKHYSTDKTLTGMGYGFLWWFWEEGKNCAIGAFGQDICIDHDLERVVVQQRDTDVGNLLGGNLVISTVAMDPNLSFQEVEPDGLVEVSKGNNKEDENSGAKSSRIMSWLLVVSTLSAFA